MTDDGPAFTAPHPDPELERLEPLLGTWKSEGEPAQKGVSYWFYDSDAGTFGIIFFSNNGPFSEAGNRYSGRVAEGRLTLEGPARFQYELDDAGRIKVNPDGTLSISWWLRDDAGVWQPWMTNTFHRGG